MSLGLVLLGALGLVCWRATLPYSPRVSTPADRPTASANESRHASTHAADRLLKGFVRDADTGSAIQGAAVFSFEETHAGSWQLADKVVSGVDGAFALPCHDAPPPDALLVRARGYQSEWKLIDIRTAANRIELAVRPGGVSQVLVTDPTGLPIGDARVLVRSDRWGSAVGGPCADVRTNAHGVASTRVSHGDSVAVSASGYEQRLLLAVLPESPHLRVVLRPLESVRGTISDSAGRAIEGARVSCLTQHSGYSISDRAGGFHVAHLVPGTHEFLITSAGCVPSRVSAVTGKRVRVTLRRASRLSGVVLQSDGASAAAAEVQWKDDPVVTTHAHGGFTMESATPGRGILTIRTQSHEVARVDLNIPEGEAVVDIVVNTVPRPTSHVPLRIVRANGAPLVGARVSVTEVDAAEHTDDSGRVAFHTSSAPGTPVDVFVHSELLKVPHYERLYTRESPDDEFLIRLAKPRLIRFRVVAADNGAPPDPASLQISVWGSATPVPSQGTRFSFLIDGTASARMGYQVRSRGFVATTVDPWTPAADDEETIRLVRAATLRGSVTAGAGPAVARVSVQYGNEFIYVEPSGRFVLDGVTPGQAVLRICNHRDANDAPQVLSTRQLQLSPGQVVDLGRLHLPDRVCLSGVVRRNGQGQAGVHVVARTRDGDRLDGAYSASNGSFSLCVPRDRPVLLLGWDDTYTANHTVNPTRAATTILVLEEPAELRIPATPEDTISVRTVDGFLLPTRINRSESVVVARVCGPVVVTRNESREHVTVPPGSTVTLEDH